MPEHLIEDDVLLFADLRNIPYLKLVREVAEQGLTPEDLKKLINIAVHNYHQDEKKSLF